MTDTPEWTDKSLSAILNHLASKIDNLNDRVEELESAMPCPHRETEEDYSFDGESENRIEVCTACGETL
jgi:hypothetical protein